MFNKEIIIETIFGKIAEYGISRATEEIKRIRERKALREETFISRVYRVVVQSFFAYLGIDSENVDDEVTDKIYAISEEFVQKFMTERTTYSNIIRISLKNIDNRFQNDKLTDEVKIQCFLDLLYKNIAQDTILKSEYDVRVAEEIKLEVSKANSSLDDLNKKVTAMQECIGNNDDFADKGEKPSSIEEASEKDSFFITENVKADYIQKWENRLFLHRQITDKPFTLKNTFIMPSYILEQNEKSMECDDLKSELRSFMEKGRSLLILGSPGMGKTSIVCYLADKYREDSNVLILRFSDWEEDVWEKSVDILGCGLLNLIKEKFHCNNRELQGKTLILDGFDEIKYRGDTNEMLRGFLMLIREIKDFRVIITSRENYVDLKRANFQKIFKLSPFDGKKIIAYANRLLGKKVYNETKIAHRNKEVFGIPVILYMAVCTGINISRSVNRSGIYNQIFSLNGGIFDRFCTQINDGYENTYHRLAYVKDAFYNILCNTAFYMFEHGGNNQITVNEYQKIIDNEGIENTLLWCDFPIDNLYETGQKVEFVHKSIYEYFTAEHFFRLIKTVSEKVDNKENNNLYKEAARLLSSALKKGILTNEICNYIQEKLESHSYINNSLFFTFKKIFGIMLTDGMTYYLEKEQAKGVLQKEILIFINMMDLLHLWKRIIKDFSPLTFTDSEKSAMCSEIRAVASGFNTYITKSINLSYYNLGHSFLAKADMTYANLQGALLEETNMSEVNLRGANLIETKLQNASFIEANLQEANLEGVDLRKVELRGVNLKRGNLVRANLAEADLEGANLAEADLRAANLKEANLHYANLQGANLGGANLRGAFLAGTDLRGARLQNTLLRESDLREAIFIETDLVESIFEE